jgi:hypothetical protein
MVSFALQDDVSSLVNAFGTYGACKVNSVPSTGSVVLCNEIRNSPQKQVGYNANLVRCFQGNKRFRENTRSVGLLVVQERSDIFFENCIAGFQLLRILGRKEGEKDRAVGRLMGKSCVDRGRDTAG